MAAVGRGRVFPVNWVSQFATTGVSTIAALLHLAIDREQPVNVSHRPVRKIHFLGNNSRYWWILVCFLIITLAATGLRIFTGFTFPIPWSDETDFIAQALVFSRTGSFFVSAMNPDRIVMWMPPGYMLLLAATFKVFGYSFDIARWVSCILFIVVYALNIIIVRQVVYGWRLTVALALSLCAFLSPYMLATANIARMESMYMLAILGALYLTLKSRLVAGLSLVVLTAIIHFNAVYFLAPYGVYLLWAMTTRTSVKVSRIEWLVAAMTALSMIGYATFVGLNWPGFMEDMRAQFAFKALRPPFGGSAGMLLVAVVYLIPAIHMMRDRALSAAVFLSFYGAGFILLSTYGGQMWYAFADCLGFFLLCLSLLEASGRENDRGSVFWTQALLIVCACALVHFSFIRRTMQFDPIWPTWQMTQREYVSKTEMEKVSRFIRTSPPGTVFNLGHSGIEPFFLLDLMETGKHWNYGVYSVIQQRPRRGADYRVICDSALAPSYMLLFENDEFRRKMRDTGCEVIDYPHKPARGA